MGNTLVKKCHFLYLSSLSNIYSLILFETFTPSKKKSSSILFFHLVLTFPHLFFSSFLHVTQFLSTFNIQLDSADEQAAAIRRELDGRRQKVSEMERNRKLMPRFVLKEMESLYIEECRSQINQLMQNLESLPVSKGSTDSKYGLPKLKKYNHRYVYFQLCLSFGWGNRTKQKKIPLKKYTNKPITKKKNLIIIFFFFFSLVPFFLLFLFYFFL